MAADWIACQDLHLTGSRFQLLAVLLYTYRTCRLFTCVHESFAKQYNLVTAERQQYTAAGQGCQLLKCRLQVIAIFCHPHLYPFYRPLLHSPLHHGALPLPSHFDLKGRMSRVILLPFGVWDEAQQQN